MTNTQKPHLKRNIGLIALTLYGVGDILGAGVYGLIGKVAGEMGSAAWMAFLVSMIAAGLTGLSYASLGSRYPKAGGAVYVTSLAFRNGFLSYVVGLALLMSGLTSMATASRVFAGYLNGLFQSLPIPAIILGFALVLTAIVFWGIRESMWANSICTMIELFGLLVVIFVGYSYLGDVSYTNAVTPQNLSGDLSISLLLSGAVLTFYSFIGFEDMINVAEEVKNPKKNIPKALLLAVVISSAIYMTISLIAVSVIPAAELADSKQPLVDVVARAAPWFPTQLFTVIALFAVSNTALLNFIMGSRLIYGMAEQQLLPKALGHIHKKRSTPHRAIFVVAAILLALALSGDISSLAKATSVLLLLCFVVVNLSLIILQRKGPMEGTFEIPSFVPALGALICIAMLAKAKSQEWITAGILIAVIIGLYLWIRPPKEAIEKLDDLG